MLCSSLMILIENVTLKVMYQLSTTFITIYFSLILIELTRENFWTGWTEKMAD